MQVTLRTVEVAFDLPQARYDLGMTTKEKEMGEMMKMLPTEGFVALMNASPVIMRQVVEGRYQTHTSYQPTDWSKDATEAEMTKLFGGLRESDGVCESCYMLRTRSGACNC